MRRLVLLFTTLAVPAFGQAQQSQLPSEATCEALKERVQMALAQADRGLQEENAEAVATWSSIAANYAETHAAFCDEPAE